MKRTVEEAIAAHDRGEIKRDTAQVTARNAATRRCAASPRGGPTRCGRCRVLGHNRRTCTA